MKNKNKNKLYLYEFLFLMIVVLIGMIIREIYVLHLENSQLLEIQGIQRITNQLPLIKKKPPPLTPKISQGSQNQTFVGVSLPKNRSDGDYLALEESNMNKAMQPLAEGGLSPEESNWSLSFWLKIGNSQNVEKDRYEIMHSEILNYGGFLTLEAFSRDYSRGSQLKLNLRPDANFPYWTHYVYLYPNQYTLLPETWYHITLTFDHNNAAEPIKIYYNGRNVGKVNIQKERTNDAIPVKMSLQQPLVIGRENGLDIDLSKLSVYNRALTEPENIQVYFEGQASDAAKIIWNFEGPKNTNQWLQDKVSNYQLKFAGNNSAKVAPSRNNTAVFAYDSTNSQKIFYPQTEGEKKLLEYILSLGSNEQNFAMSLAGFKNLTAESLISDLGLLKATGMTNAITSGFDRFLLNFRDLVSIPTRYYAKESFYGKEPDVFYMPISPASASLLAYFYDLNSPWNVYYKNAALRNRITVSALNSLLMMTSVLNQPDPTASEFHFLRLSYNGYVCTKICGDLPADVRQAWFETFDRSLRQLFLLSSPTSHGFFGTKETDKGMAIVNFFNYVVYLDKKFNRSPDILSQHLAMRDEIMKLYIDPKLAEESALILGWEGTNKGIDDSGACFMDATLNSSYAGLCFDRLTELVAIAEKIYQHTKRPEDQQFLERAATPLKKLAELRYYMSLKDNDLLRMQQKVSPAHINSQHHTGKGFADFQSHSETAIVGLMEKIDPNYYSYLAPFILDRFYNRFITVEKQNGTPVEQQMRLAVSTGLQNLSQASDSTFLVMKQDNFEKNKVYSPEWGLHDSAVRFDATENQREFYQEIMNNSDLSKLAMQKNGQVMKAFGDAGHEAFFVLKKNNYYATFFTDRSPTDYRRSAERTWLGISGAGIAGLSIFDEMNNNHYVPILGRYVHDIMNQQISGISWQQWPSHQISAVNDQGEIFSTSYYEILKKNLNDNRLTTDSPFESLRVYREFNYDNSSCLGGQVAGCVHREYTFDDNNLQIKTELTNANPALSQIYDIIPAHISYNDSAVIFYDLNAQPQSPSLDSTVTYSDIQLIEIKRDKGSLFVYFPQPIAVQKPPAAINDENTESRIQNIMIQMKNANNVWKSEYVLYPSLSENVNIAELIANIKQSIE